jgi:GNAT superfamily N-acetyltransferase
MPKQRVTRATSSPRATGEPGGLRLTIRPLTPDLWPALEDLFGRGGGSNGCWCMYWRIGSEYHQRAREKNRRAFRRIVQHGPPPGLLAFDGERPVGWCQLTPRDELPWLDRARALQRVDARPVWSLSCFYVRRGYRRQGVMSALIAAALQAARSARAPALEAYPVDTARTGSTSNVFTGTAGTFTRAGFKTVARRTPSRPVMRHDLQATAP